MHPIYVLNREVDALTFHVNDSYLKYLHYVTFILRRIICNNPSLKKNLHCSSDAHGTGLTNGVEKESQGEKYEFSVSLLIFLVSL